VPDVAGHYHRSNDLHWITYTYISVFVFMKNGPYKVWAYIHKLQIYMYVNMYTITYVLGLTVGHYATHLMIYHLVLYVPTKHFFLICIQNYYDDLRPTQDVQ
jgi:hypothetical protein